MHLNENRSQYSSTNFFKYYQRKKSSSFHSFLHGVTNVYCQYEKQWIEESDEVENKSKKSSWRLNVHKMKLKFMKMIFYYLWNFIVSVIGEMFSSTRLDECLTYLHPHNLQGWKQFCSLKDERD